jgi:ribosomal protein S18 acetylase RimI-like enzyme
MSKPFTEMRIPLGAQPARPVWPQGFAIAAFRPEYAEAVHALLNGAYAKGGGSVAPFPTWWEQLQTDGEYDPELVLLARHSGGALVGVAQCWTSAFIKDLAVAEEWRGRGLGAALLQHAFNVFWTRGAPWVGLKVDNDNPSGAERLYRQVGMSAWSVG